MKILMKSQDHSSTSTVCSVIPVLTHCCCKTFFIYFCDLFYSLYSCSLGIFHVAFIKDFATGSAYCTTFLPQVVMLSKIYILKLQHAKPKRCSRNGYVPQKVE